MFSYDSVEPEHARVQRGGLNGFDRPESDLGQPVLFRRDGEEAPFAVEYDGQPLTWTLFGPWSLRPPAESLRPPAESLRPPAESLRSAPRIRQPYAQRPPVTLLAKRRCFGECQGARRLASPAPCGCPRSAKHNRSIMFPRRAGSAPGGERRGGGSDAVSGYGPRGPLALPRGPVASRARREASPTRPRRWRNSPAGPTPAGPMGVGPRGRGARWSEQASVNGRAIVRG